MFGAGQFESKRQGCKDVDVRAALFAWEDGFVEQLCQNRVSGQDDRPARPVQGLVGGGCNDMGIADGRRHHAGSHQPAQVRDIGQQVGTDRIGDAAEGFPVGDPGVGRVAADDHFRLVGLGQFQDGVIVKLFGLRVDIVVDDLVELAGAIDG